MKNKLFLIGILIGIIVTSGITIIVVPIIIELNKPNPIIDPPIIDDPPIIEPEPTWEIDDIGYVTNIVDGDTVDIDTQTHGSIRVRLADIDAPEIGDEPYYSGEKLKLNNILYHSNYLVFIDIDDIYGTDVYGRTVAVLYASYYGEQNRTINVNCYMINEPYTVIDDYYNEFDPSEWTVFVEPIN